MKSILFTRYDLSNDLNSGFVKDINKMLLIEDDALETIIKSLPEVINKTASFSRKSEVDAIAKKIAVPATTVDSTVRLLDFFFRQLLDNDYSADSPSIWADDLFEIKAITNEMKPKFISAIEMMKTDLFEKIRLEELVKKAKCGVLPSFQNISFTVDFRTVLDKEFSAGEPVKDYSPNILRMIPIVSINIETDSENENHFYFQTEADDLQIIIQKLGAALKIAEVAAKK